MRHIVSRLLIATVLLLAVAIPGVFLAQDGPSISVTPDAGVVGAGIFEINITGLTPDNTYTVEFVINGLVVFASDEDANADGNITFSAASTPDDEAGIYTVQVISNNSILTATEFELTASDTDEADNSDSGDSTEDDTPVEAVGNLSVVPPSGPISTVHDIRIRDLDPDTAYTVEITASQTESVVYRRLWTSNENGAIDIEIFAEDDDVPGRQVIRVFNNMGNLVAQGEFTVDPPPDRNASVDITPQVAQAGRTVTITVTGLAQFDSVSAQITAQDSTLIDTVLARASSEGVAVLSFMSDDELADGTYNVRIFIDGEQLAESTLTIGDAPAVDTTDETETDETTETDDSDDAETTVTSDANFTVNPEAGPAGSTHVMSVSGLEAGQAITLTIRNDSGEIEFATTRTADDSGNFSINIQSSEGDELGTYPVEISDATTGQVIASASMIITDGTVEQPTDSQTTTTDDTQQSGTASISVNPVEGDIGATHTITLSGMPAGERIGVNIRYASDNTLAQSNVVTIDESGNGTLEFTSRELNAPGEYNVVAVLPDGEIVSTTLTIAGAVVSIDPQSGAIGTSHVVTATGLDANETVTFNVMFGGESVFSTEETADADGVATLTLATEDGDEAGDYTIIVERASGNQPSAVLTVTAEEEIAEDTSDDATEETTETDESEDTSEEAVEDTTEDTTEDTADTTPVMGDPQVFEGTMSLSGSALTFTGDEGDYVLISVESDEFDPAAAVYNEEFLEIAYNNDAPGTTDSLIGPLQLPYTGSYSLEIFSSSFDDSADGAPYTVTITPIMVQTVAFDEPTPFSLTEGMSATYYALDVEAGDSLNIVGNVSGTLDTVMRVLYTDGVEFAYDDDGGAGFEAELNNLIFDVSATYILEISTFDTLATGNGTLTVTRNPVKSLEDGSVTVTLNDKLFRDLVVFDAFEGELVTLNLEKVSGSVEDLFVYASVDGMQVMSYSTMGIPTNLPLTFVMPMDGTVVVTLEEFGFGSGITFEVSVTKSRRN